MDISLVCTFLKKAVAVFSLHLLQRQCMLVVGLLAEYVDEVEHLHLALRHAEILRNIVAF